MKIFSDPLVFGWDKGNINKSEKKHGISYKEAEEVFINKPFIVKKDDLHSSYEARYHALGKTNDNKLLFLSYTLRNNIIRIISARPMSKKERGYYEKYKANTAF